MNDYGFSSFQGPYMPYGNFANGGCNSCNSFSNNTMDWSNNNTNWSNNFGVFSSGNTSYGGFDNNWSSNFGVFGGSNNATQNWVGNDWASGLGFGNNAAVVVDGGYTQWGSSWGINVDAPSSSSAGNTTTASTGTTETTPTEVTAKEYDFNSRAQEYADSKKQLLEQKTQLETEQAALQKKIDAANALLAPADEKDSPEIAAQKKAVADNVVLAERARTQLVELSNQQAEKANQQKEVELSLAESEKNIAQFQVDYQKEYEALKLLREELLGKIADLNTSRQADANAPVVDGLSLSKPEETAAKEKELKAAIKQLNLDYGNYLTQVASAKKLLGIKPAEGETPLLPKKGFMVGLTTDVPKEPIVQNLADLKQFLGQAFGIGANQSYALNIKPLKLNGSFEEGFVLSKDDGKQSYSVTLKVSGQQILASEFKPHDLYEQMNIETINADFEKLIAGLKQAIEDERNKATPTT